MRWDETVVDWDRGKKVGGTRIGSNTMTNLKRYIRDTKDKTMLKTGKKGYLLNSFKVS